MAMQATSHCLEPSRHQVLARVRNDTRVPSTGSMDRQGAASVLGPTGPRAAAGHKVASLRTTRVLQTQRVLGNRAAQRVVQGFATPAAAIEPVQGMHSAGAASIKAEADAVIPKPHVIATPLPPPVPPPASGGESRPEASLMGPAPSDLPADGLAALSKRVPDGEGLGHPVAPQDRDKPDARAPPDLAKGAQPLPPIAAVQAQLITVDAARSEAEVSRIGSSHQKQVSGHFGGMRSQFSGFFAQSIAGVQQFVATRQREISAAAGGVLRSAQALVAGTMQAARTQVSETRETIDGVVNGVAASLQERVGSITAQIMGVVDRVSIPDLPGAAQVRDTARSLVRSAAGAVTGGLDRVRSLIGAAVAAAARLLSSMLDVFHGLVDGALSQAASTVQRLVQRIGQALNQMLALVIGALRKVLSATILPMIDRLERAIGQAIAKATQQATAAIRANRDEHLRALKLATRPDTGDAGAALRDITREATENNRRIVNLFEGRISTALSSIFQAVAGAAAQIIGRIASAIAQAVQLVAGKVAEVIQGFGRIAQAVGEFVRSVMQALTGALRNAVQYVRTLVQNPVDQLLDFARGTLNRIGDLVVRLIRSVIGSITGTASKQGVPPFALAPNFVPAPAFVGPAIPAIIYVLTVIVTLVGGTIVVIGGTVMIIIGGSVFFVSTTTVVIVAVVVALLLLILFAYLLYRWTRPPPPKRPPPGCTPTPPVPFAPGAAVLHGPVAPSIPLDPCDYGFTFPESVNATISARCDGTQWVGVLTGLTGNFSEQVRLLPGQQEVTGPAGNTRRANFCAQATELNKLGDCPGVWYMISAVQAHEDVHLSRFHPALVFKARAIESSITALAVPDAPGKTAPQAAVEIAALPAFPAALAKAQQDWLDEVLVRVRHDHDPGGPCDTAEHAVVDPMVNTICTHAKANAWGPCAPVCPP